MISDNELDMELILQWLATSSLRTACLEDIPAEHFKRVESKVQSIIQQKAST